jgi:hypothetical protein
MVCLRTLSHVTRDLQKEVLLDLIKLQSSGTESQYTCFVQFDGLGLDIFLCF